jgi:hypothetical protein
MSSNDQSANVLHLLEELYLDSTDSKAKTNYAKLSDEEKRTILLQFADSQAATSKRWTDIVADLRVVGLKLENAASRPPIAPDGHCRPATT